MLTEDEIKAKVADLTKRREMLVVNINAIDGALQFANEILVQKEADKNG